MNGSLLDGPDTVLHPEAAERRSGLLGAWGWLLMLPVSMFVGFFAAHVPYAVFPDQVEGSPGPWWFELLVGAAFFVVAWLPVGASLVWGRRALRAGSRWAWLPVGIDLALTVAAVALIVVSAFG